MEDFEYSVEICDRDWECFFAECEECALLPPSLARVDDSGMSDMDDAGAVLAKRAQRAEAVDGPPAERGLGGHGGPESVLSGSEEDIHLRSVNLFFEGLKGLAEDGRCSEPGKSREEEGEGGEEGRRASGNTLPKYLELNRRPAEGETAVGNETLESEDTVRHTGDGETEIPDKSETSETSESAKVSITESTDGTPRQNQPSSEVETFPGKVAIETSTRNPDVRWKEAPPRSIQAWSPASVKRRRRKKRRLGEGGQVPARQSDTDEDRYPSPGSSGSPEDAASCRAGEPQRNVEGSTRRSDGTAHGGPAPRRNDGSDTRGKREEECDRWSGSVQYHETRDGPADDVDVAVLRQVTQHHANGKCHWAEVGSLSRAHAPAVAPGQNDRRSAAKSAAASEAGKSVEGERARRQAAAEPQQQLEGHCRNADQDGGAAAHLPGSALKSSSPVNGSRCEAGSPKETQINPSDCRVDATPAEGDREGLLASASADSACSLESVTSLSDATDLSACSSSSLSEGKSVMDQDEADRRSDSPGGGEETVAPQPENGKNSVFAISSFWSEMEKLTINDILGLRMMSRASPAGRLPPLRETEEADAPGETDRGVHGGARCEEPISSNVSSPKSVTWDSEPVLPSLATEDPPSVFPARPRQGLRAISKNVSVHNLHALESRTFDGAAEEADLCEDGLTSSSSPPPPPPPPPLADSYSFSLTDVLQFLFRGKPSLPDQPAPDGPAYTCGNSVPESYDHFFSEFDTESFFYPLMTAEDRGVPIFSCARSARRNLQFPEAYDYFFKSSSSSDDSSSSDEDGGGGGGGGGPVRVVTRFSRKASSSQLSTDAYEDFFTDREEFFWKTTFSFRNVAAWQRSDSRVPPRESGTSYPGALDRLAGRFPDPPLVRLEDTMSRRLVPRPLAHEDVQTVMADPRLDAAFLPLRQSDMCMVCIAFASWVLKTSNPQVGDAWKAVLLANVSALSAIRYLRRYVRVAAPAAPGETQTPES